MRVEDKPNSDMSMEEILKSIREVINNRDSSIEKHSNNDEDILELTHIVEDKKIVANANQSTQLNNNLEAQQISQKNLASDKHNINATNILQSLFETAKINNKNSTNLRINILEDLLMELLQPQLNKWLNKNLPYLVKQLVEKEIRRLLPDNQK